MIETTYLVPQKLLAPVINKTIMRRPRLTRRINKPETTVISIVAPAGFGKTVLLLQLAETINQPSVWYQLDEYDNDPVVFWRYLAAGFQKIHPAFGKDALLFISSNRAKLDRGRTVLSMFINDLHKLPQGATLILDDCHVISEADVKLFMEEFLRRLPPGIRVLTAGRTDVFQSGRLLAEGKMLKYEIKDLYFTREEIAGYYAENGIELAAGELGAIAEKTGGWPIAVGLALNFPSREKALVPEPNRELLFHYMASEILAGESESIQRFLAAISVLEEITPELCDLLLDRNDSRSILARLHGKYFFLSSLSGKSETYRCHRLFREFLLERLGNEKYELMEKAGMIAFNAGKPEQAVEYFIAAGNLGKAGKIMAETGRKLIGRGNWHTVERWLDNFPEEETASNPWLTLFKAQIDVFRGRIYSAESRINHASAAFLKMEDRLGLAESYLMKAKIFRSQGFYRESLKLLELAAPDLESGESPQRFDIYLEKSYSLMFCGRFAEAEKVLTEAVQMAERQGDSVLAACFYEGLGTVNFAWGYYDRSLYYCRRSMAILPDKSLRNLIFQDSVGPIYLDWGELEQAYEYLRQSVTAKENFGAVESLPSAYCQFGNVLLDRGELQEAEEYLQKAISAIENQGGDHFVHILSCLLLSACLGAQRKFAEARELIVKAHMEANDRSQYLSCIFQVLECIFLLQTGNAEEAVSRLRGLLPELEAIGARKPLCIAYSILALAGFMRENAADAPEFARKAFGLAAEMNYIHDFLLSFDIYRPLLYIGLETGIEVPFIQKIMVKLGERAIPILRKLAEHSDASVRLRAVEPLARIGGENAAEILNKLASDEEIAVSRRAGILPQMPEVIPSAAAKPFNYGKRPIFLGLLGHVRIFNGDREISHINWIRSKSRDLLAYLAHLGCPAGKQKIIDALWPDISYQLANTHFHIALHNLRQVLEGETGLKDLILYRGGRYCLPPENVITDKQRFRELLAAAGHHAELSEVSARLLEEAVALYRGDYLEELDYIWVIPEQEHLKQAFNSAGDRLSLYYLRRKDYSQAIIHLKRLVRDNPLTEEYYSRLLSAFAATGDLKAAYLYYCKLDSILKEELDIQPSDEIRKLYSDLFAGR